MRTITHRELRNNSSSVLREVKEGAGIEVTNHGEPAAVLVPPSLTAYERLVKAGKVREPDSGPRGQLVDLRNLERRRSAVTSRELIAEVRGDR